ncbi:MAG: DUF6056 family protein [Cruoricaptor ignavus]|nr:DUF6056 family protein [Cruoricaptor ignavus]
MKKNSFYILLIINLLIILPLIYLSFYNYPSADDFSYAADAGKGFMERQISRYNTWTSRYMATALLTTSPLNFGSDGFFGIYTLVFILLFYIANGRILADIGISDKNTKLILNLSFISVYTLLQTSLVENYFWLAGSATYFLPSIFFVIYISCLIRIYNENLILQNSALALLSLFIIGGSSEILVGFSGILTGIFGIHYFIKSKKINIAYAVFILFISLLVLFVALSPGNAARGAIKKENLSFLEVFMMSFNKLIIINLRYLIFGFLFFVLVFKALNFNLKIDKFVRNPLLLFLFYNFLLFIGSFITIYKLTYYYPPRVENLLVFVSLIFIFILAYIFHERFSLKIKNQYYRIVAIVVILVYLMIPKNSYQKESNLQLMYADIFERRAIQYKKQIAERKKMIKSCDDCTVPAIKNPPKSILFKDITTDTKHYINGSVSFFHKIKSIKTNE